MWGEPWGFPHHARQFPTFAENHPKERCRWPVEATQREMLGHLAGATRFYAVLSEITAAIAGGVWR